MAWVALASEAIKSDSAPSAPFKGGDLFATLNNQFSVGSQSVKIPPFVWWGALALAALFVVLYQRRG